MIYQEEQDIQEKQPENASFATISQVFEDGVTLRFGQEDTPSQKRYRVNSFAVFHAGDRVSLAKDSGTYVVLFPVGKPKSSFRADTATTIPCWKIPPWVGAGWQTGALTSFRPTG